VTYNSKNENKSSEYKQESLFSEGIQRTSKLYDSGASYEMGGQSLLAWKQAISKYQSSVATMIPAIQTTLFDLPSNHCDPHAINPFYLPIQPAEFYRLSTTDGGDACISHPAITCATVYRGDMQF
jgi:hypothetical protein